MPGLPNADRAVIDERKITRYLLADEHPVGRAKATFFRRFGFRAGAWEVLRKALLAHANSASIVSVGRTDFGNKYIVEGPISAADGRRPHLRSIWFVESGDVVPRLVTAYPVQRGDE